ncbi:hypothetical protein O9G_001601 [Rozella allomycis CSF55]|uniref:Mitochondrial import inner membrane translocase subunit n=1 Tax=Rozella allomycis (strain CSF55) TaxID=988480 RepID=A0A075ASV4_ROZAC|nr:hypothetical protein O9G_001601 [Rozella allomycis CSF55]|eukprot:EPZ33250.1 hypothetical protein O9G_001601 [Rozella allomycis CSF55]
MSEQILEGEGAQVDQLLATFSLLTDISDKCFKKCVPKIQNKLEKQEETCLAYCTARYFDVKLLVAKRLQSNSIELSQRE